VVKAAPLDEPLPPPEISRRGVLYRPNITRTLTVLRKADPYGRDPWRLVMTKQIEVPNRAPTFVAEVHRSLFVDRITDIEFDNGVLTNISVKKPSELAAAVQVPLAIATAVVALPALVVQLKINDANNQQALIDAQGQLIAARRQYNTDLAALVASQSSRSVPAINTGPAIPPTSPIGGDNRSLTEDQRQTVIQNCLKTGRSQDMCETQLQDIAR
jgi:hypothetical protein